MRLALGLAALAALLAGCVEEGIPADARVVPLQVSFRPGYSQADVDEACRILACGGFEASDPPRTAGWFSTLEKCEAARERVLAVPHAVAAECGERLGTAWWSVHGAFLPGYTEADIAAVCKAGTGRDACAILKSEPPQFNFAFATREACEDALADIRAVPRVDANDCFTREEASP